MGRCRAILWALAFACFATGAGTASALTVVLDAGHGGHDRGGIPRQATSEKAMALDVAKRVESRLRGAGVKTVMTRREDYFVSLPSRVAVASRYRGGVFVSIHFNSTPHNPNATGIETYYYTSKSARLAAAIHARVVRAAGTGDRKVRRRGFYVLRRNPLPAVLVECGFLTSRKEAAMVRSATHREKLAAAIAAGVLAGTR